MSVAAQLRQGRSLLSQMPTTLFANNGCTDHKYLDAGKLWNSSIRHSSQCIRSAHVDPCCKR